MTVGEQRLVSRGTRQIWGRRGRRTSFAHEIQVAPIGLGSTLLVAVLSELVGVVLGDGSDGGKDSAVEGKARGTRRPGIGHEERLVFVLLVRGLRKYRISLKRMARSRGLTHLSEEACVEPARGLEDLLRVLVVPEADKGGSAGAFGRRVEHDAGVSNRSKGLEAG